MKVAGLDSSGDWQFGRGLATYKTKKSAIVQNVSTRIKSFANDWFLDMGAEIDWIGLTGRRNSEDAIISEIQRVVLETDGVTTLDVITVDLDRSTRHARIELAYSTIFDDLPGQVNEVIEV